MLLELRVHDLGIVEDLGLVMSPGLTAITGETGAGKTLIVEAIELLVGGRAAPDRVRAGADEARVEARFELAGEEHVLARVVPASGRSRAYIDGRMVTVGELAEIGRRLVDLHGQHSHQSLLSPAAQRDALDAAVGPEATNAHGARRAARDAIREIDHELGLLGGDDRTRAREIDLLTHQLTEIDDAEIDDVGEDERLEAEAAWLANAEAHHRALTAADVHIAGTARDAVGEAIAALGDRAALAELTDRLRAVANELDEAGRDVRSAAQRLAESDPERLGTVQDRRRRLQELRRKYGATLGEVLAYADSTRERLAELASHDERRAFLLAAREQHRTDAADASRLLYALRSKAAGPLASEVESHLRELALPHARFEVLVVDVDAAGSDDGDAGTVEFRFAANAGEPLRPLAKVASGGELSRTMLAARVVLTAAPPTLVFDEVDAGIGGEAGTAVGRLLARLGTRHQVLCVTHLAQVAASAGAQVMVDKHMHGTRTVAAASVLDGAERVAELSRMLAGVGESRHAREHAAELLATAHEHA